MQDLWREYVNTFSRALVAHRPCFSPCTSFWPGSVDYGHWQSTLKLLRLDRLSRDHMLNLLFYTVELRCGQPQERQSLEIFRASPFLQHCARTHTVNVFIDYLYDPWMIGSIAYDYPNVAEIHIVIEAPLERRDRDDLTFFVRQMCMMGKKVTLMPAWRHWQARHRSDILAAVRPMFLPPSPDSHFDLI